MKTLMAMTALAGLVSAGLAQDHKEMPKPGKEHALLQQHFVGDWDASSKHMKDGKSMDSKGTETVKSAFNGYWLMMDYKGDMNGKPYQGHGMLGYDPAKKKYMLTWVDNWSPYSMWSEGEADASGKTFTFTCEGFCPELGKVAKMKTVMEIQNADHRTLTFFMPGKDGAEQKMGTIEYTRRS